MRGVGQAPASHPMVPRLPARSDDVYSACHNREAGSRFGQHGAPDGVDDLDRSVSLEAQEALREIAGAVGALTDAQAVLFWIADEPRRILDLAASWQAPAITAFPAARLGYEEGGAVAWVAMHGRSLFVADVGSDARFAAPDWWRAHELRSFFACPLLDGETLLGVMALGARGPWTHEPAPGVIQRLAGRGAGLIRHARRFAESERRRREAEALAEVGRVLTSTPDAAETTRTIVELARAALGSGSAALYLIDEASGDLILRAVSRTEQENWWPSVIRSGFGASGLALREGRAVLVTDQLTDPRLGYPAEVKNRLASIPGRARLSVPLVVRSQPLGVLNVGDVAGRRFEPRDVEFAETLGRQVALALENARLFAAEVARREQSDLLGEVARRLLTEHRPAPVLQHIADAIGRAFNAGVSIWLVEDDGLVERSTSTGGALAPGRLRFGEGIIGLCAARRAGISVNDYPAWPHAVRHYVEIGLRHASAQPMLVGDDLLGVVGAARYGNHAVRFTDDDVATLLRLADLAALAHRNATLYETAEQRQQEAEALAAHSRALPESLDPSTVARQTVARVRALLGAPVAVLYRLDEASGALVVLASSDVLARAFAPDTRLPPGVSVAGLALRTRAPAVTPDVLNDDRISLTPDVRRRVAEGGDFRSAASVPLQVGGQVIGALTVADRLGHVYRAPEVHLLEAFAGAAALALQHAELHAETENRRREAEILSDIARHINASLDVDVVLEQIAEGARALCRSDAVYVALRDSTGHVTIRHRVNPRRSDHGPVRITPDRTSLGGLALVTRRPVRTDDWAADARFSKRLAGIVLAEGFIAQMVVPIGTGDVADGLVYVANRAPRPFTDLDEAALVRLAEHAAIALHNAELFEQRRRAEAAVRDSERLYRLLAENSADVISVYDLEFRPTYISPSVVRLRGYTPEEAIRQSVAERLTPASQEVVARSLAADAALEAAGTGDPDRSVTLELEVPHKDGGTVWTETSFTSIRDERRQRVGFLAVSRNITERKQTEAALRARDAELQQAQKMEAIGQLAGGIAHDFNNLLTIISGRADVAMLDPSLPAAAERDVKLIKGAAERAALLTRQLLAFSRRQIVQPRRMDLTAVVGGFLPMLRRLIGEQVAMQFVPDPAPLWITADPGQIEQVVLNLVVNARDAMPDGGRLTIRTSALEEHSAATFGPVRIEAGSSVLLTVSDTGIGIDADVRDRIFEPFFTTKPPGKGTGLGLATVFGIVKQCGGQISVDSEPGLGTTVTIGLPRADAGPGPERPVPEGDVRGGTETILLVEDEPEVRAFTREMLTHYGYVVIEAPGPIDAQRLFEQSSETISLVVTDVVMPDMSGLELVRRLRSRSPMLKVLYVSGYATVSDENIEADARFLQKPFSPKDLAQAVRDVLDAPA